MVGVTSLVNMTRKEEPCIITTSQFEEHYGPKE